MKKSFRRSLASAAGLLALLALSGCYAYPVGYAQGGYYGPAVAPGPVVVEAAPVVVPFGFYGGGYGYRGGWRR